MLTNKEHGMRSMEGKNGCGAGVERVTVPGKAWRTAPTESFTPSPGATCRSGEGVRSRQRPGHAEAGKEDVERGAKRGVSMGRRARARIQRTLRVWLRSLANFLPKNQKKKK